MAKNNFITSGIGIGAPLYDKNANDIALMEAHKIVVDENDTRLDETLNWRIDTPLSKLGIPESYNDKESSIYSSFKTDDEKKTITCSIIEYDSHT
jgi:hypothetical protein